VQVRNLWLSVDPAQRIWMWRDSAKREEEKPHKHVLVVSENFDQIDFTRELKQRVAPGEREVPASAKTPLKLYQNTGVAWLLRTCASRRRHGPRQDLSSVYAAVQ
jgi:hypothetical protein